MNIGIHLFQVIINQRYKRGICLCLIKRRRSIRIQLYLIRQKLRVIRHNNMNLCILNFQGEICLTNIALDQIQSYVKKYNIVQRKYIGNYQIREILTWLIVHNRKKEAKNLSNRNIQRHRGNNDIS